MSEKYKLMIYFAHSTFVIYSKDIQSNEKMTVQEFRELNQTVCKRIFDEATSIFNYELSYEQISIAIAVYLKSLYYPLSVKNTKTYVVQEN